MEMVYLKFENNIISVELADKIGWEDYGGTFIISLILTLFIFIFLDYKHYLEQVNSLMVGNSGFVRWTKITVSIVASIFSLIKINLQIFNPFLVPRGIYYWGVGAVGVLVILFFVLQKFEVLKSLFLFLVTVVIIGMVFDIFRQAVLVFIQLIQKNNSEVQLSTIISIIAPFIAFVLGYFSKGKKEGKKED